MRRGEVDMLVRPQPRENSSVGLGAVTAESGGLSSVLSAGVLCLAEVIRRRVSSHKKSVRNRYHRRVTGGGSKGSLSEAETGSGPALTSTKASAYELDQVVTLLDAVYEKASAEALALLPPDGSTLLRRLLSQGGAQAILEDELINALRI